MRKFPLTVLALVVGSVGLSGCGPSLPKLNNCTTGKYRYANPNGVSLPSLEVPTPEEIGGSPPPPGAALPPPGNPPAAIDGAGAQPAPTGKGKAAPVATPPKRGAMILPTSGTLYRSC